MGARFLVTGVQLGMIKGFLRVKEYSEIEKLIDYLIEENNVGRSENEIKDDCKIVSKCFRLDK